MQVRLRWAIVGLIPFFAIVGVSYHVFFQRGALRYQVYGKGNVAAGELSVPLAATGKTIVGRARVTAGEGATIDFGEGLKVHVGPRAVVDVASVGEQIVNIEWMAGPVRVAHAGTGQRAIVVALGTSAPGGGQVLASAGTFSLDDTKTPFVETESGTVLIERRGEVQRARAGERFSLVARAKSVEAMREELVSTISDSSPSRTAGNPAPAAAETAPLGPREAAREAPPAVAARPREAARAARLPRAVPTTRAAAPRAATANRDTAARPTAAREEPPETAPDELPRTRIKRTTTWR